MNPILSISLTLVTLIPCLGLAQTEPNRAADGHTGIEGTISMTPVQGGPTRQGERDSAPLAHITFEVRKNDQLTKTFQTDDRGQFHVELEPGHYTIARKDWQGAVGFYGPFEVKITQGKMAKVEWKCDTGMR